MKPKEKEFNDLIQKILNVIYWNKFTSHQTDVIKSILEGREGYHYKANEICDYLGIPKRENRSAITNILKQ